MLRSISLAITLLAAWISFGSSVGVYAPAIVPVNTLKSGEWKKYEPAAFGSNTTGKIQAFYDMMCERVDLMSSSYAYATDKTDRTFAGCPDPYNRATISREGNFPSGSMYVTLYDDMCNFLKYVTSEPTPLVPDGYTAPEWESRLCYDIGLSVSEDGMSTRSEDIYTFSLGKFGYTDHQEHGISNELASIARSLGVPYTLVSNHITHTDIEDMFCRFSVSGTTNLVYVEDLNPHDGVHNSTMDWAPLYAFDRICADVASRNVSVVKVPKSAASVTTTRKTYTYTFNFDTNAISDIVYGMYDGSYYITDYQYPISVTVAESAEGTYAASTPWASAVARTTVTSASGYIDTISGATSVQFTSYPSIVVSVVVEQSDASISGDFACANEAFIVRPEFFDSANVHMIGKVTQLSMVDSGDYVVSTNLYFSESTTTSAVITSAIEAALPDAFAISQVAIGEMLANITNAVGGISMSVDGTSFSSSWEGNGTYGVCRLARAYDMPYAICENKYNFTEWSGHVSEITDAMDVIGPKSSYEIGTVDAWVDASAASGGDGSSASPFQTIDEAITAVNPSGGSITASGTVPRIGIRPGTYVAPSFWNIYGMSTAYSHPAYNVQLVGVGDGVTINRDSKYMTGYFQFVQEQYISGSGGRYEVYLADMLTTVENVTLVLSSDDKRTVCQSLNFKNCKITGNLSFRNGVFCACTLENCLIDDATVSKYSHTDTPSLSLFNGAQCYNCIFKFTSSQADAYLTNKGTILDNCVMQAGASRIQGATVTAGKHVFVDSTIQASSGVDTSTYPIAAENCIFFIDDMIENATYSSGNIITNSLLFEDIIDTHTYMPNDQYWQWRTHGFQTSLRTE